MDLKHICRITLGTAQLGLPYGISGRPLQDEPEELLHAAYKSGINTIDTAQTYGNSEEIMGRYLKGNPSWSPNIITKIVIKSSRASGLRSEINKKIDGSLGRLGQKRIFGVMIHRYEAIVRYGQALVDAMTDLKKQGKTGKIGVSIYNERELKDAMGYCEFELFQGPCNIFDHRIQNSGLLQQLEAQKKMFFARSVYLQGLFFLGDELLESKIPEAKRYVEKLRRLAKDWDIAIDQMAFSYVMGIKGITSFVFGIKNKGHLERNMALLNKGCLPETLKKDIDEVFRDVPQGMLDPRTWCLQ
jgi:aryl-alcohol dehydrogenase-like predicted oxidoreductase